jgi:predicted ATPase/class 3 adenylate cyclase
VSELPSGIVTLLLADVEGSTLLWETRPDAMTAAFAQMDRVLARLLSAHAGVRPLEQGEGDSFVLAFRRAGDAVACALELQKAQLSPIRLRIGVHTGEAQLRDENNYIGPTINKTARIRDLGHGGQTLLSGATEEMIADGLPLDAWLTELGIYPLRGVARPERIVQLCHADLRNNFPPLRTTYSPVSHNLPEQLTSFVGRLEEIKCVQQLIADNRLVVVTGAGGAGKTRLALQTAAETADEYRWVRFVDLAPITDPGNVPMVVGGALGLSDQPDESTIDVLIRFIGDRRMLMVLDNCEHLIDASADLCESLLGACPGLKILATSREPIGLTGEVTWRIPSLSISDEAIELFRDRARRSRQDFCVTEDNVATLREICQRLDGMPLAIELAAARVRALSLTEIAQSLHDRFSLLTGGARTLMARQQTLRASVDWSHEMLSEPERTLFRRLAVFVGGFDLDALCAIAADEGIDRYPMLDNITSLVDRSLVVAEESRGHTRYRLLETVRQYAIEKLHDSGEDTGLRRRHRDYYMKILDLLGTRAASRYEQTLEQAVTDIGNLRAAFAGSADLEPDPDMLTRAARGAAWLTDIPLSEELANAAIQAGAGAEASIVRAHNLLILNRGEEANALLLGALSDEPTDVRRAELYFLLALNTLFTLADPLGAKKFADEALEMEASENVRQCIGAFFVVYWAAMGKPPAALDACDGVIREQLPDIAARVTAWAVAVACGDAGFAGDATAAAEAGYPVPVRGMMVITDAHIGALLLAGDVNVAQDMAKKFRTRGHYFASAWYEQIFAVVVGRAALGAGRLPDALSLLDSAAVTLNAISATNGWEYRTQLALTVALAMTGMTDEAAAALSTLDELRHPSWRYLDYELGIAKGWVAASRGAVSEAIAETLAAAEIARENGQFAAEVMCLQTAAQFGDGSSADRLRDLSGLVEGPRVAVAGRLAAALKADDAAELVMVSTEFENLGDIIAALDAAAHAALVYRRHGAQESASECARRARTLVERCGASTPALIAMRNP